MGSEKRHKVLPLQSHLSFHLYVFHSPVIFLALVKLHPLAFRFHFQPKKNIVRISNLFSILNPLTVCLYRGKGGGVFVWGKGLTSISVKIHFLNKL